MVFNKNFVAVIKANGKILREMNSAVRLPFGTEYSILLKNLDTRRAVVTVTIDGQDALDQYRLIIDGNSEYELKRFIVDGNLDTGPRFKFIEKSSKISEHRGDKVSDGIVRIEYQFEREVNGILKYTKEPTKEVHNHHHYHFDRPRTWGDGVKPLFDTYTTCDNNDVYGMAQTENIGLSHNCVKSMRDTTACSIQASSASLPQESISAQKAVMDWNIVEEPVNDAGITTYGNDCDQSFSLGHIGALESTKNVICLQLLGSNDDGSKISSVITVKKKIICNVCGNANKSSSKFCSECGTNIKY